ncbi:unnamed protein product [Rangifer tarandus platyrhynchus]|uniref:Uncharacterized protein n=1 Tax=Rangifer tarandus platyrhynchus TaxID=3082113 RepID=A0ACB1KDQ1_RANTA
MGLVQGSWLQMTTPSQPAQFSGPRNSWLQLVPHVCCRHLGKFPDKGSFHQVSSQDAPGEMCKETPPGTQQLWWEKSVPHVLHVSSAQKASASSLKHFSSFCPGLVPALVSTHSDSSLRALPTPQPLFSLDSLPPTFFSPSHHVILIQGHAFHLSTIRLLAEPPSG